MIILLPLHHSVEEELQSVKFASDMEVSWPLCQPFTSLAASLAVVEVVVEVYDQILLLFLSTATSTSTLSTSSLYQSGNLHLSLDYYALDEIYVDSWPQPRP